MKIMEGQIWDRRHRGGKVQVGLILQVGEHWSTAYVLDGYKAGTYDSWSNRALYEAIREERMVQLA